MSTFTQFGKRDKVRLRSAVRVGRMDASKLSEDKPHGTRIKYMGGCKCMLCRAANSRYEVERAAARKAGDWNGIVPANAARQHLGILSRSGTGRRAVAEACDVGETILSDINTGKRINIRKRTETAILSVTIEAAADGGYIDAKPMWKQISMLLSEGFSKAEIARRIGMKNRALQLGRERVTARNSAKIDKLFRIVMAE